LKVSSQKIQRLVIASALASGLVSAGVAASAQTANEAAVTNQTTTASAAATQTITAPALEATMGATNMLLSSADSKAERLADFEQANADEHRRMLFRNQGTSL
jgi:hypothetical protein